MKKNELFELVHSVAVNSMNLGNAEDKVRLSKKQNQALAIKVVNYFEEVSELLQYLTDTFQTMDSQNVFGLRGNKTQSGTDYVTIKMNGAARFFHRAYNSLENGFKLSGYSPFKITEVVAAPILTDMDKLVQTCEGLGLDVDAIAACKSALVSSTARADGRRVDHQKQLARMLARDEKDLALMEQERAIDAFIRSGMTVAELEKLSRQAAAEKTA